VKKSEETREPHHRVALARLYLRCEFGVGPVGALSLSHAERQHAALCLHRLPEADGQEVVRACQQAKRSSLRVLLGMAQAAA
jgi:hypothetical protein